MDLIHSLTNGADGTYTRDGSAFSPTVGYAVGASLPTLMGERLTGGDVALWLANVPHAVAYFGAWRDGGILYVDAVDYVIDRDAAVKLGRERGELAIYAFDGEGVIDLR